jgi:hypothetical protein
VEIDRDKLLDLMDALGSALRRRTALCLVGGTPGIYFGQPARTTRVIDIWEPMSRFDAKDLTRACERTGVHYHAGGELGVDALTLRVLRPGTAAFPEKFEVREFERHARLTLLMPSIPTLLVANLAREMNEVDIDDFVFWMAEHRLKLNAIATAIEQLEQQDKETAKRNFVLARVVAIDGPGA